LKYWFSEYEIYKLLRTDVVLKFLIDLEYNLVSFVSKYLFFDFVLIDLKYWLLDFLFLNSLLISSFDSVTPDILVDFCSTYKFFCIKLLLAVSDRWLWLIMGMFKMFFSTVFYFVYDDIFGFFMLYRGTLNMPHSYIPLDPMGFKQSTYYKKQFKEAKECFQEVLKVNPNDKVSSIYLQRSDYFIEHDTKDDWDGISILTEK